MRLRPQLLTFDRVPLTVVNIKPKVHTLVDGEACDKSVLMIDVSTQRAHTVGAENMILVGHMNGWWVMGGGVSHS